MPGQRRATAPRTRPEPQQRRRRSRRWTRGVRERRLEERVEPRRRSSGPGRCRRRRPGPPARPSRPSSGRLRSAMWCSGPGKPTSVSSTSPVAGLTRRLDVVEVPVLELAGPRATARPRRRGRSSATCRSRSGARRGSRPRRGTSASPPCSPMTSRISSLEKKPENGGTPDSARPPMTKQPKVNGIALRKPPIRSRLCSPAIAPMIEPAAMNSSALKKACVMRWNMPAT